MKPLKLAPQPSRSLPAKSETDPIHRLLIGQALMGLQDHTVASTRAGTVGRPHLERLYMSAN